MLTLTMMNDNDIASKFKATIHILFVFGRIIRIWPNSIWCSLTTNTSNSYRFCEANGRHKIQVIFSLKSTNKQAYNLNKMSSHTGTYGHQSEQSFCTV